MGESPLSDRPISRYGRRGAASFFGFVVFVLGQFILVFWGAFKSAGSNTAAAWTTVVWDIAIFVGLLIILFSSLALWRSSLTRREKELSSGRPDAMVFSGGLGQESRRAFKCRRTSFLKGEEPYLPLSFTIVVSEEGLELWTGWNEYRKFYQTPWALILGVSAEEIAERGRRSAGLLFTLRLGEEEVGLPIIITGRGFARLFPERLTVLENAVQKMGVFRTSS